MWRGYHGKNYRDMIKTMRDIVHDYPLWIPHYHYHTSAHCSPTKCNSTALLSNSVLVHTHTHTHTHTHAKHGLFLKTATQVFMRQVSCDLVGVAGVVSRMYEVCRSCCTFHLISCELLGCGLSCFAHKQSELWISGCGQSYSRMC